MTIDDPDRSADGRRLDGPATSRRDLIAVAGALASTAAGCSSLGGSDPADEATADRVEDRLSELTLEQKVDQMIQEPITFYTEGEVWEHGELSERALDGLADAPIGSVMNAGGSAPVPNTPRGWATATNRLQTAAVEESDAGVPLLYGTDAVHGHNNLASATMFPHNLGVGATWDPSLARRIGEHVAGALRATGVHWNFDPVADLARDHRWGRYYECYGEDPLLVASMVGATVEGLQDGRDGAGDDAVAATPKHFVGYSRPRAGRDRTPAQISRRQLLTRHLVPFQAGVDAGAETVMLNSGSVNGVPGHASSDLVRGVLREDLGFDGVVVSDWADVQKLHSVHGVGESLGDAVRLAIEAGVDVCMTGLREYEAWETFHELADDGTIPEERIDESVRRILRLKARLGLFEDPFVDPDAASAAVDDGRDLAREAAARSLTLLENDGTLPLAGDETVLVAGPAADDVAVQMGGWTVGWEGVEPQHETPPAVTGLAGIESAAPADATVTSVEWTDDPSAVDDAATAAADADVAVLFLGEAPYAEGEGDDPRAELAPSQVALVEAVGETGTPVAAVLFAGRPLSLEDVDDRLSAVLMAYLPGTAGGTAVGRSLFGDVVPSGRLPVSWPRHGSRAPVFHDRLPGGEYDPRYEFGAGESYTEFSYGRPVLEPASLEQPSLAETFDVTVPVENAGHLTAAEVVLVTATPESVPGPEQHPARAVLGFDRVELEPGERRELSVECAVAPLAVVGGGVWGDDERRVRAGEYAVEVGQRSVPLRVT